MAVTKKYLAVTCAIIFLACLLVFQANLPPKASNILFQPQESRLRRHQHLDYYDDFFNGIQYFSSTTQKTEVPRIILGSEIRYILNNPICDSTTQENSEIFMLVLITSFVGDVKLRRKLREVVPQSQLDGVKVKRLFLLAKPPPRRIWEDSTSQSSKYKDVSMKEILEENQQFHDILMGDFTESYKSLTYKHLMGLEWAATFCQNAKFVLKQDDDILVDYFQMHQVLNGTQFVDKISKHSSIIFGKVLDNQLVDREPESKWFVSKNEYPEERYPPYVSGWAYVTTIPAIQEILKASQKVKYFFIDDAFITGILREMSPGVTLIDMKGYFTHYKGQILCCVSVPMFAKSRNNEPYWCDYLVGPSNDDLELMEVYHRHSEYCFVSGQCKRRGDNELLASKCVITGNMKIQDFSQFSNKAQGNNIKARPLSVIRKQ